MISLKSRSLFSYVLRDLISFAVAFLISYYFFRDSKFSRYEWVILSCLMFLMFMIEFLRKPGNPHLDREFGKRFAARLQAYVFIIILVVLCYLLIPIKWYHKGSVIAIITGVSILDLAINYLLVDVMKRGSFTLEAGKNILVAGIGNAARNVEAQMMQQNPGTLLKGFISCNDEEDCVIERERILGNLESINEYLYSNPIDEIVIALPTSHTKEIQNVLSVADYHGVRVKYILDYQEIFGSKYRITRYGHIDALNVRQFPVDGIMPSFFKGLFDKLFATFILIFFLPIFIMIAIIIKLDSPGPVFYFPIRIGKGGRPFKVFKFRSMRVNDNENAGTLSTQKDDPRITKIGRFLRKYSLDELPQFINVFIGEMSVVGPRPHRRYLNRQLQDSVYKYMIRHYVKPGITGWAQVNGWRGPTDTEEQRRQRTIHDLWYIENWSFFLDLKIIYLTLFSKKTGKDAF